ncbi:MAG: hypothetical protein POELPBGB_01302 [Bacteroidia bacterium]|nr:hypothetical protein [Bacteroidia bacterium]
MSSLPELNTTGGRRRYGILSVTWLFLALIASHLFVTQPLGFAVLSVFVFAVPVALSGGYSSAVNQIRALSYYKEGGRAHRFLSQRWLRTLIWVMTALATTFLMLLQFATYTAIEWVALAIAIPLYWVCHTKFYRFLASELKKPFVTTSLTITWARWLCPLFMLCIYGFLVWILGGIATYDSLSAALVAKRAGLPDQAGSQIVQIALRISTFADGFKSYAIGHFSSFGRHLPLVITALGTYLVLFNACTTLSCFSIPSHEMRRVIGPLSDEDVPPPIPRIRAFITSAVVTFVALFIYIPIIAGIEAWVKGHPAVLETIGALEKQVEKIDGAIYSPGTIAKIELAKAVALGKMNVSRATMEGQVDRAFDRMEHNVDGYLDWYYSLTAEYMRLGKLLTGEIESYMEQKLSEHLQNGDASKMLTDGLSTAASTYKAVMDEYRLSVEEILKANRLGDEIKETVTVRVTSMKEIYSVPVHLDSVTLTARASGGAVGASIGAGIGAAVTAKVVSKGMFKAAAKAVAKIAASKVAGTGGGAVIGAAIGSVVPGAGTVVGGVVGGVIGGVLIDATLLKLEESINREEFKREIVTAIREAKAEFKAKLFAHP